MNEGESQICQLLCTFGVNGRGAAEPAARRVAADGKRSRRYGVKRVSNETLF